MIFYPFGSACLNGMENFGTFNGHFGTLRPAFDMFFDHLVYFVVKWEFWYIVST
jgi:hypothetical protein